ncbi:sensor histidine kinase, partial [Hungatella sp. SL.1.14]|nr:sensor histidine kinase [Hungatella sp. SL.1.14]
AAFSMIRRYKAGTIWTGSLTKWICVNVSLYIKNHRFTTRLALGYICYFVFNCVKLVAGAFVYFTYDSMESRILTGLLALALLCMDLWVFQSTLNKFSRRTIFPEALLPISAVYFIFP